MDYGHTVFGQIVEGLNVAEAITQVKVSAEERKPKKDVVIESVEIVDKIIE
ncbi:MAG: peptidylprolyl isomerase [Lacrimispora sphenoides]